MGDLSPVGGALADAPDSVSPGRFAGQTVLVSGAAQGIGLAVAQRIAFEGARLMLADRSPLVGQAAAWLREQSANPDIADVVVDLETSDGAAEMVAATRERFGELEVAVNVVGGTIWAKPFEHYQPAEIEREITRSLMTTLWSVHAELPELIARGGGCIVNVSSVATRGINRVPYAAAKGGVNALTAALALEAAHHGVRVVATAPGGTLAPRRQISRGPAPQGEREEAWYRQIVEQTIASSPMGRYGTLAEQAAPIAFLASREASYITGSVLPVAGGDQG